MHAKSRTLLSCYLACHCSTERGACKGSPTFTSGRPTRCDKSEAMRQSFSRNSVTWWSVPDPFQAFPDVTRITDFEFLGELGDPSKPDEVAAMLEYSPLLNIRQPNGTHQYPAMLITVGKIPCLYTDAALRPWKSATVSFNCTDLAVLTRLIVLSAGTADDRVNPAHSYKFVAQLQGALTRGFDSPQHNPIVLRTREGFGHIGRAILHRRRWGVQCLKPTQSNALGLASPMILLLEASYCLLRTTTSGLSFKLTHLQGIGTGGHHCCLQPRLLMLPGGCLSHHGPLVRRQFSAATWVAPCVARPASPPTATFPLLERPLVRRVLDVTQCPLAPSLALSLDLHARSVLYSAAYLSPRAAARPGIARAHSPRCRHTPVILVLPVQLRQHWR